MNRGYGAVAATVGALIVLALPAGASAGITPQDLGQVTLAAPDPGGDPNAAVPLPPPGGKYMGFNDDSAYSRHGLTPADYAELSRVAGGNLIRASLDWRPAEPLPGVWNPVAWADWQKLYDEALARGLTPMFTIGFAPVWARDLQFQACGEGCRYPPSRSMNGRWGEFAAEVARRFPRAVIEIWNEPNYASFWGSGADPGRYAELLAIAYDAIKAVSPGTLVLGGALSNLQVTGGGSMAMREYLDALYAANPSIAGHMDALSFHPYPDGLQLGQNSLFAQSFADVRGARDAHGDSATPLFASEVGIAAVDTVDEAEQADALRALYRRVMTMGDVTGVVFHRLIEPADTTSNAWELGAGWLRYGANPPAPRAVYCDFAGRAGNQYLDCPPPKADPEPEPGGDPPQTSLKRLRGTRAAGRRARFRLTADEPATFECRLDRGEFRACRSPYRTPRLRPGRHRLMARAVDDAGQRDPTPAKSRFKIRRQKLP